MLKLTLVAFTRVLVPFDLRVEMIIVDNGSKDETPKVIRSAFHPQFDIHYVLESRPGKSGALNLALAKAKGDVLLFTDDDVEPASDWIEKMARPLFERRCEAVSGRIILAEELQRSWLTPMHLMWLAVDVGPKGENPILIGACMGLHRSVFEQIGGFDEELGPGASGFGEETLIWQQIKLARLRIISVENTSVIHRPDPSRLLRSSWLSSSVRYGKTDAYCKHHWDHAVVRLPHIKAFSIRVKLFLRCLFRRQPALDDEGCPAWEMSYRVKIESLKEFVTESRRPRNYKYHGLRKLS